MPTEKAKIFLERAGKTALAIIRRLEPYCKIRPDGTRYIQVAGDIRRRRSMVKAIDIVLVPGDAWNLYNEILLITRPFKPNPDKPKIKHFNISDMPVDLYIADEKEWATILLIRTGSAQNNIRLSFRARELGWQLHADGSGLFNQYGKRIICDTEASIYESLGLPFQPPRERK